MNNRLHGKSLCLLLFVNLVWSTKYTPPFLAIVWRKLPFHRRWRAGTVRRAYVGDRLQPGVLDMRGTGHLQIGQSIQPPITQNWTSNRPEQNPPRAEQTSAQFVTKNLQLPAIFGASMWNKCVSGRKVALTEAAKSNFLSFNEGWSKGLIKYPLITSLFLCVCPDGRQRKCVCVLMKR